MIALQKILRPRALHRHKFGGLPVVEHNRLVGIIMTSDLLRHYIELPVSYESDAMPDDLEQPLKP